MLIFAIIRHCIYLNVIIPLALNPISQYIIPHLPLGTRYFFLLQRHLMTRRSSGLKISENLQLTLYSDV